MRKRYNLYVCKGLDPEAQYEIKEINLLPDTKSILKCNGKTYSGEYLMKVGIPVFSGRQLASRVIEISKNKKDIFINRKRRGLINKSLRFLLLIWISVFLYLLCG